MYSSLLNNVSKSALIKHAKTKSAATNYLENDPPPQKAIIITDEGVTQNPNTPLLRKIKTYTESGGLVIVGLHFPSYTAKNLIDNFFADFGLSWKAGAYQRDTFQLNPSSVLPDSVTSSTSLFPGPYSMKALHIQHAQP
ncbi:hypothetical protein BDW59DRAFT_144111 [Aspergillus cavernicola]|uniref:Uncharacterized protein n=1 Tax=Aspergillus cavernicola TaxID=176166 RepID=A0ABR4IJ82_9EURO